MYRHSLPASVVSASIPASVLDDGRYYTPTSSSSLAYLPPPLYYSVSAYPSPISSSSSSSSSSSRNSQGPRFRRKLSAISAEELWCCPNEGCERQFCKTSSASIKLHSITCPYREAEHQEEKNKSHPTDANNKNNSKNNPTIITNVKKRASSAEEEEDGPAMKKHNGSDTPPSEAEAPPSQAALPHHHNNVTNIVRGPRKAAAALPPPTSAASYHHHHPPSHPSHYPLYTVRSPDASPIASATPSPTINSPRFSSPMEDGYRMPPPISTSITIPHTSSNRGGVEGVHAMHHTHNCPECTAAIRAGETPNAGAGHHAINRTAAIYDYHRRAAAFHHHSYTYPMMVGEKYQNIGGVVFK